MCFWPQRLYLIIQSIFFNFAATPPHSREDPVLTERTSSWAEMVSTPGVGAALPFSWSLSGHLPRNLTSIGTKKLVFSLKINLASQTQNFILILISRSNPSELAQGTKLLTDEKRHNSFTCILMNSCRIFLKPAQQNPKLRQILRFFNHI